MATRHVDGPPIVVNNRAIRDRSSSPHASSIATPPPERPAIFQYHRCDRRRKRRPRRRIHREIRHDAPVLILQRLRLRRRLSLRLRGHRRAKTRAGAPADSRDVCTDGSAVMAPGRETWAPVRAGRSSGGVERRRVRRVRARGRHASRCNEGPRPESARDGRGLRLERHPRRASTRPRAEKTSRKRAGRARAPDARRTTHAACRGR